ncbi:hypothetical protein KZX46_08485 [Polymorphobacter sp. PAMC 29334]|uniref:hypothetical protein n=1 Tax=Polymorphobacter sp. PAMC 29334 TaxID=2862331 RepID=UPI001C75067F|nr:hypothetical protein [Polymorphobacter sp. PAMC 29334]QYE35961.1 hypothetical protein KZX46_08485 [Polymorphobacter sp. PAMC 29334]
MSAKLMMLRSTSIIPWQTEVISHELKRRSPEKHGREQFKKELVDTLAPRLVHKRPVVFAYPHARHGIDIQWPTAFAVIQFHNAIEVSR